MCSTVWRIMDPIEISTLMHFPSVTIALFRTVRDGSNYASALTPIPEDNIQKVCLVISESEEVIVVNLVDLSEAWRQNPCRKLLLISLQRILENLGL